MAAEIADGMAYLESKKIIHRSNVFKNTLLLSIKLCYFDPKRKSISQKLYHNGDLSDTHLQGLGYSKLHGVS